MALTLTQLQDYINTNVKKNGRNAITGDQMNYLMLNFVDWVSSNTALPDKASVCLMEEVGHLGMIEAPETSFPAIESWLQHWSLV
jgi:hypothetical protein